jgi:hypothetical protein
MNGQFTTITKYILSFLLLLISLKRQTFLLLDRKYYKMLVGGLIRFFERKIYDSYYLRLISVENISASFPIC